MGKCFCSSDKILIFVSILKLNILRLFLMDSYCIFSVVNFMPSIEQFMNRVTVVIFCSKIQVLYNSSLFNVIGARLFTQYVHFN